MPAYQTYTKRAKFSEVISAAGPAKTALEVCVQEGYQDSTGLATTCQAAAQSALRKAIPAATNNVAAIASDAVATNGTITVTGTAAVDNVTFMLVPSPLLGSASAGEKINWTTSGSCKTAGFC